MLTDCGAPSSRVPACIEGAAVESKLGSRKYQKNLAVGGCVEEDTEMVSDDNKNKVIVNSSMTPHAFKWSVKAAAESAVPTLHSASGESSFALLRIDGCE